MGSTVSKSREAAANNDALRRKVQKIKEENKQQALLDLLKEEDGSLNEDLILGSYGDIRKYADVIEKFYQETFPPSQSMVQNPCLGLDRTLLYTAEQQNSADEEAQLFDVNKAINNHKEMVGISVLPNLPSVPTHVPGQ